MSSSRHKQMEYVVWWKIIFIDWLLRHDDKYNQKSIDLLYATYLRRCSPICAVRVCVSYGGANYLKLFNQLGSIWPKANIDVTKWKAVIFAAVARDDNQSTNFYFLHKNKTKNQFRHFM